MSGMECQRRKNKTVYFKWQNFFKQSILTWFYQLLCDCYMSKDKGTSTIYWPLNLTKNCLISVNMLFKLISSWSPSFKVKVFPPLPLRYCTCKNSPLTDWTIPKYVNTFCLFHISQQLHHQLVVNYWFVGCFLHRHHCYSCSLQFANILLTISDAFLYWEL